MNSTRISTLSASIQEDTSLVDGYLQSSNLPQPSFDIDAPLDALAGAPSEVQAARDRVIDNSTELQQLLAGNFDLLGPKWTQGVPCSLQAIYRFQVASKLAVGEEITISELADRCNLYEHDLRRLIRFAIAHHRVFQEPRRGYVAHTAASKLLAESKQIQTLMGLIYEETSPAHAHAADALERFRKSQEPNASGYSLANGTTLSMYDFLQTHPDRAQRFSSSMSNTSPASLTQIGDLYDWAALPQDSVVVDVGGARGHVSAYLAERFPHLKFVVQDLQEVIQETKSNSGAVTQGDKNAPYEVPENVRARVQLMGHDFFTQQPVKGAAVYFIRYTLHNWSDAYCVKILRNLLKAMEPGAHIVIQDHMLPEPGSLSPGKERNIRAMDLIMLSLCNSREREEQDWANLFEMTDENLKLTEARRADKDSASAVIVATWKG